MVKQLAGMSEAEVLDFAGAQHDAQQAAEVNILRAAFQWAIIHTPDTLGPEAGKPGRLKARALGGPGTPAVTEKAAASFGARIGRSPYAAARLSRRRHPTQARRVAAEERGGVSRRPDPTPRLDTLAGARYSTTMAPSPTPPNPSSSSSRRGARRRIETPGPHATSRYARWRSLLDDHGPVAAATQPKLVE